MPFWAHGQEIEVELDQNGRVSCFYWRSQERQIEIVSVRWRVHTAWWTEQEIWRDYWEVATRDKLLCTIYQDLLAHEWRLERIYE